MVVVSEPRLVAQLLHNVDLAKPTEPVMVHFRQVRRQKLGSATYSLHASHTKVKVQAAQVVLPRRLP